MIKYFRLLDEVHIAGRWHLGEVIDRYSKSPLELWRGVRAKDGTLTQATINHVGKELEFCLTSFGVPVARRTLAQAISLVGNTDLQRLPLFIHGHEGFEI